eukprot:70853-Chlamydomonas_euryale.AAC.7
MVEWLEFMSESGLYHKYFTQREAKLAFIWARLRWRDESSSVAQWNRTRCGTGCGCSRVWIQPGVDAGVRE